MKAISMPKAKAKPAPKTSVQSKPKPFDSIVILAPSHDVTAAEAELRLRSVAKYVKVTNLPPVMRISGLNPSPEATALALYRTYRAVGRGGPVLYVVNGNHTGGALCALTTDWGNTILCANDGTLSLLASLFSLRKIPHTLTELNTDSIINAEQTRMQNPEWLPAPDFALRDILAPAAALLLAGTPLKSMAQAHSTRTNASGLHIHNNVFCQNIQTLPLHLHKSIHARAMRLSSGNILINLTLDPLSFDGLLDDTATFTLSFAHPYAWLAKLGLQSSHTVHVHAAESLHHKTRCKGHMHLSPLQAPVWNERFLEVSLSSALAPSIPHIFEVSLSRTR
jgi:hypothetical protein